MITFTFTSEDADNVIRGPATIVDTQYFMVFKYDGRHDRWRLDLFDENNDLIAGGIKIVTDIDLLIPFTDSRLPDGELFVSRIEGQLAPVTRDELGSKVFVNFFNREELDILQGTSFALRSVLPPTATVV